MTANKWADYCISAVKFNNTHTHIDKVKAHSDEGDKISAYEEYTRLEIISMIKKGKTFVSITKDSEGKWKKGQPVFIVLINNVEYIKTVRNDKAVDNLDDLPEF